MIKTILIIVFMVINSVLLGQFSSLYSDHKSFTVGDIITILIEESASANASAGSHTDKGFDHSFGTDAGTGPLDFIPLSSFGVGSNNRSSNDARTTRQGSFRTTMTARIIEIDEIGNLKIMGSKTVKINGEEETTTLEGIVRSADIQANNTVYSYNIADAKISYKGKGAVNDGAKVGFLTRVFNFIF